MRAKAVALMVWVGGLTGCGGTWVDTPGSGGCRESQIEDMRKEAQMFNELGNFACSAKGLSDFAGEFRCAGSADDGTLRMQVKCDG